MSFRQHIVDTMEHGMRLIETITPLPAAKDYPCKCCDGRGAIATITQYYRLDRDATAVEKKHGGEVRCVSAMRCPACNGKGVDQMALMNDEAAA